MAARQPTPILQACPPLSHVAFFSAQHPGLVVVQGFCACRRDQGEGPPSPSRRPRPDLLGPQDLPRPLAEPLATRWLTALCALLASEHMAVTWGKT
jgi:hypothetical protein